MERRYLDSSEMWWRMRMEKVKWLDKVTNDNFVNV
jgi:hypothetical protein